MLQEFLCDIQFISSKVCELMRLSFLIIFEWFVARLTLTKGQQRCAWCDEIGLCAQNICARFINEDHWEELYNHFRNQKIE